VVAAGCRAWPNVEMGVEIDDADVLLRRQIPEIMPEGGLMAASQNYRNRPGSQNCPNQLPKLRLALLQSGCDANVSHIQRRRGDIFVRARRFKPRKPLGHA